VDVFMLITKHWTTTPEKDPAPNTHSDHDRDLRPQGESCRAVAALSVIEYRRLSDAVRRFRTHDP